jgi:methylenetetrahydrofolate dehydrogenase (NADP+)/methenyltetrahydrofolate cyclohydrolase
MAATLMLGNEIATKTYEYVKNKVESLSTRGVTPYLVAILVGDDPGSMAYLKIKAKMCMDCGIKFSLLEFPSNIAENELIDQINLLNQSLEVTGIIIQLPLPISINRDAVLLAVSEHKDIDAFSYTLRKTSAISVRPPAPAGMIEILNHYNVSMANKRVVIVGEGLLVGQPLEKMLIEAHIYPTVIHDQSEKSLQVLKEADVVFCGVGKANIITPEMLRFKVVVIDAGYNKVNGVTYGDCDLRCAQIASFITPSIGGIGPLTVSNLLKNVVDIIEK